MTPWRARWGAQNRPRRGWTRRGEIPLRAGSGYPPLQCPGSVRAGGVPGRRGPTWHPLRGSTPAHGGATGCIARVPPSHAEPATGGAGEASSRPRRGHPPFSHTPGIRPQARHQRLLAPPRPGHCSAVEGCARSHQGGCPGHVGPLERAGPQHPSAPNRCPRRAVRGSRLLAGAVQQAPGGPSPASRSSSAARCPRSLRGRRPRSSGTPCRTCGPL